MRSSAPRKDPGLEADLHFYKLWKVEAEPVNGANSETRSGRRVFVGRVFTPCTLGKPLHYITPDGHVYRTSRVQQICTLQDGYCSVRTCNTEYIVYPSYR